jgi:uncharacterized protein YbjT (DUF2867 family)
MAEALTGAQVVVDLAETPSFEERTALDFFVKVSRNLLAAETIAGVGHHIALSAVGVDRIKDSCYFRAKAAQEDVIRASSIPYTIVRSTQFFDLIEAFLQTSAAGDVVYVPPALIQPVAPDDVADALAEIAVAPPLNETIEMAGSEPICFNELARLILSGYEDPRRVITDAHTSFFGAVLDDRSFIPGPKPWIGPSTLRDWLRHFITPG